MKEYAKVNNAIIMVDDSFKFHVYDRNMERLTNRVFDFAADAIDFAHKYEKKLLEES